jgi:cell division protein FtsA
MAGYNLDSAFVSLGGASIVSQNSHGVVAVSDGEGEIKETDVDRVIEAASAVSLPASREVIHVIPREFTVDGESGVKDPMGMSGVRLEVETHIITASTSAIKNLSKVVGEVGVNLDEVVFSGLAASEAVLTPTEKELGCVVVDIGGGTTAITAYKDGSLAYSGVIPIGARNVTNDLAIGLRVSLETAEKVKLFLSKEEKAKQAKNTPDQDMVDLSKEGLTEIKKVSKKTLVEGIIRPRLNEIFTMVKLELDKVGLSSSVPSGVVVTGGGAETVGVAESAKRILSLPVRIGIPKGVGGLVDDILTPSFSVPIGLIIYAAGKEPIESSPFSRKFKVPVRGVAAKIIETIKDLLP